MELFYTWIFIAMEITNTFLASYLMYYLYKRKNQFPFANVSPIWIITFITGVLIHNIFQISVVILVLYNEHSLWLNHVKVFSSIFVHYVWIWPIIGRLIYITESVYFNYSFIQDNLNIANYKKNMEAKQNKKFTEDKNLYISKLVIMPFFILFFVFLILTFTGKSFFTHFDCYFYSFNSLIFEVQEMCTNDDTINKNIMLGLIILKYSIDFLLQFLVVSLVYIVFFRFKIKNDKFFMKTEVLLLTVFWCLIDNTYHGILLLHKEFEESIFSFSYNIFQDFAFILLYYYLTFKRSKIDSKNFSIVLHNFEMFMQNPIYFNYFREYIQKFYEDEEGCLIFWRRCHHYKSNFKSSNLIDNVNEAYTIFGDCIFDQKMSSVLDKYTSNQSNFFTETNSRTNLIVELPIDMYEMIEDIVNQNFIIDDLAYYELFDEAFQIINAKLYNRYLSMFRNQQEYEKLNKLICYMEFDMIDDGLKYLESANTTRFGNFSLR